MMTRALPLLLALHVCAADQLTLSEGGRLTGEVLSMGADGMLSVRAEVAVEPLVIQPDHVERVDFETVATPPTDHDARLLLINGDDLPCELLGIDAGKVRVSTSFAGELEISRNAIERMQLGIRPHALIITGVGASEGWTESDAWVVADDTLVSSGTGHTGLEVPDLPKAFSLSFQLKWEERPSFKVYFCAAPDKGSVGGLDRYYLQFNSAGFGVGRQSTGQTSYFSLGSVNQTPDKFKDNTAHIELRVDREAKVIELHIDGTLEGRYPDQIDTPPEENGVVFESATRTEGGHRVSDFEIRIWDASGDRYQSEDRGPADLDAVIDNDGQRFSGELLRTEERDGASVVLFQSPHLEDPLVIPVERVSTVFLAKTREMQTPSPLYFGLHRGGRISAEEGQFDKAEIKLRHPLLGALTLDRGAVASLDRREIESEPEDDE